MEIKRSPDVARPVEVAKKAPRWPWVLAIVVGVVLVLGVGVVAFVMYTQKAPEAGQQANTTTNTGNSTNSTEPTPQPQGGARTINPTPNASDLSTLVFGRYDDPLGETGDTRFSGPLTLVTEDVSASRSKEAELATLDRGEPSTAVNGIASPNGQFLALYEAPGSRTSEGDEGSAHIWLVDLTDGGTRQEIADNPALIGRLVWSSDSKTLTWGEFQTNGTDLVTYDLVSGETRRDNRPTEEEDRMGLLVTAIRDDELFAVRQQVGTDDVGSLGVIKVSKDGALDGDFEKLFGLPAGLRGIDISADGRLVAIARGSGERIDAADSGPFVLELFDRSTGDVEQLRTSPSEGYSSPLFTPDGDHLIYAAASGLWSITINDSGDRSQLIDSDALDSLVPSAQLTPLVVQPDGSTVVFTLVTDKASEVFALATDAEEASADDVVELSKSDILNQSVFGWTE